MSPEIARARLSGFEAVHAALASQIRRTMAEPATMVSAAREIGKICGLYEPQKVQINVSGSVQHEIHRFEAMTDAELLEVLAQGLPAPENPATALSEPSQSP